MADCPCGSGRGYADCCQPVVDGSAPAATAEALMRARYAAFVNQKIEFLTESLHPKAREDHNPEETASWAAQADWLGFDVLSVEAGGEADEKGIVEFEARYRVEGKVVTHHERSEFAKEDGRWFFVDGRFMSQKPLYRDAPKVGRNDPCPCGSGKKYKKCCGVAG